MITHEQFKKLKEKEKILKKTAEILRVEDKDLIKTIERFLKDLEK